MRQNTKDSVMEVFYEHPNRSFTVREVAKLAGVPRATVHKELTSFKRDGIITIENKANSNLIFRTKKINYFIEKIANSGLIEEIINKLNPSCIILFGSIRKGDSIAESDIDLFVESPVKKHISLAKFEKKLRHKIQLFIEPSINDLNKELFNNVVNGIKLFGSFKIR